MTAFAVTMTRLRWFSLIVLAFAIFAAHPMAASAVRIDKDADLMAWTEAQLDAYYRTLFALQGQAYVSPEVVILQPDATALTACGPASGDSFAAYCVLDQRIVFSQVLLDELAKADDAVPAYVLAHEWSHHIQSLSGTLAHGAPELGEWNQVHIIESELRADCLAGSWLRSLDARDLLDATDMSAVLVAANEIGDSGLFGRSTSHGTGEERLRAVLTGYEHGLAGCMAITPLARDAGPSILTMVPH